MSGLLIALHVLAAVFWVGGMAFAYMILRPAAGPLEGPVRLTLWRNVFSRFLPAVGAGIVVLLVSGYVMLFRDFGGFARAPVYIHVMQGTGILMMLLFLHLYFVPWQRFQKTVRASEWPVAGKHLAQIRRIVAVNLVLGVVTIVAASAGRYW
ncbi:MAG: CopD family protein [Pseudorhodoplanes sp.]|nr:hypothetical protein [Pseudorhodoplanes sp.]MBW7950144.1 CopD family protein [Pseudorhodoplanes sp.]MCL4710288.1 CopD family protein [Pseudorhodoplanes sp.]MCQ3941714.1 hypothetical protein [Alphaproteobacteria bacterium]